MSKVTQRMERVDLVPSTPWLRATGDYTMPVRWGWHEPGMPPQPSWSTMGMGGRGSELMEPYLVNTHGNAGGSRGAVGGPAWVREHEGKKTVEAHGDQGADEGNADEHYVLTSRYGHAGPLRGHGGPPDEPLGALMPRRPLRPLSGGAAALALPAGPATPPRIAGGGAEPPALPPGPAGPASGAGGGPGWGPPFGGTGMLSSAQLERRVLRRREPLRAMAMPMGDDF